MTGEVSQDELYEMANLFPAAFAARRRVDL
jgi:hypothetical protein